MLVPINHHIALNRSFTVNAVNVVIVNGNSANVSIRTNSAGIQNVVLDGKGSKLELLLLLPAAAVIVPFSMRRLVVHLFE